MSKAVYVASENPDYRGNPFIEALPARLDKRGFYRLMTLAPTLDEGVRRKDANTRMELLDSCQFFVPSPHHFELYNAIHSLAQQSYIDRNPFEQDHWSKMTSQREDLLSTYDLPIPRPRLSLALIGCSGLGKSIYARRVAALFPKTIEHGVYEGTNHPKHEGKRVNRIQIPFIYIEALRHCSVKDICRQIFSFVNRRAGTDYTRLYGRQDLEGMVAGVAAVAQIHAIGLIVLDELQELAPSKSGGINASVSFLLRLTNTTSNATLMIGTPQSNVFMSEELRYIRRASGIPEWRPFPRDSDNWRYFVTTMWPYQFTRAKTELTPDLEDILYSATFGIPEFAVTAYKSVQKVIIQHTKPGAKEVITPELMRRVASTHLAREIAAIQKAVSSVHTSPIARDMPSEPVMLMPVKEQASRPKQTEGPRSEENGVTFTANALEAVVGDSDSPSAGDKLRLAGFVKPATEFCEAAR